MALPHEHRVGLVGGRVGDDTHLTGAPDAVPLADEAPRAEQVGLHVEPVLMRHVAGRVGAGGESRGHPAWLERRRSGGQTGRG